MTNKQLLIVGHVPSPNIQTLRDAVERGARHPDIEGVEVNALSPFDATPEHVKAADAIILGTTENLGYMSGALKDFFDRIYYPCLDHTQGLGYGLFIKAGNDGQGALSAVTRIITGLAWRALTEPVIVVGELKPNDLEQARELGRTIAAGLEAGLF